MNFRTLNLREGDRVEREHYTGPIPGTVIYRDGALRVLWDHGALSSPLSELNRNLIRKAKRRGNNHEALENA